jgi:hypothetical protein
VIRSFRRASSGIILGLAGITISLDFILPSGMTLFFDELILFSCVWAMRRVSRWT